MGSKRAVFRVQLDIPSKQALERLCEQRGMTQIAVMSRLVTWFAAQDENIQAAVLRQISDQDMAILARELLRRMADGSSNP
jgi:hypothetical protein